MRLPLFVLCAMLACCIVSAQVVHDTTEFTSPAREAPVACATSGLFLVAGGVDTKTVDILDTATGVWRTSALSAPRSSLAAANTATMCFFGGGTEGGANGDVVDIFNAATGAWTTAKLSAPRDFLAGASNGEIVMFAGGLDPSVTPFTPSNVVDVYQVATKTWTVAHLSEARAFLAGAATAHTIIFAGGESVSGNGTRVDLYHTETGTWSIHSLSRAGTGAGAATSTTAFFSVSNGDIDVYDENSKSWHTIPAPVAGASYATAAANEFIAVFSGGSLTAATVFNVSAAKFTTSPIAFPGETTSAATTRGVFVTGVSTSQGVDIYTAVAPAPPSSSGPTSGGSNPSVGTTGAQVTSPPPTSTKPPATSAPPPITTQHKTNTPGPQVSSTATSQQATHAATTGNTRADGSDASSLAVVVSILAIAGLTALLI